MTTLIALLSGLIGTVLSDDADLYFHCDDTASAKVSTDSGVSWTTYTPSDMLNTRTANRRWRGKYYLLLEDVDCDTIVEISCSETDKGPEGFKDVGGFMGDVHYPNNNPQHYFTNEQVGQVGPLSGANYWELVSSTPGGDISPPTLVYSPKDAVPWERNAGQFDDDARWVWNEQSGKTMNFRFDFANYFTTNGPGYCCIEPPTPGDSSEQEEFVAACAAMSQIMQNAGVDPKWGSYYFPSCDDRDHFIQCDAVWGGATEHRVAPGTCWDECINGQINDQSDDGHPRCSTPIVSECEYP